MKTLWYSSIVHRPPMPTPINTPTWSALSSVILNPDWRIACSVDATAYWMKGSIFLTSRFSIQSSGLKSFTSPAIRTGNPEVSKRVIRPIPDRPAIRASQFLSTPTPSGVTSPTPVTTTRRSSIGLIRPLILHRVRDFIIYQKTAPVENPRPPWVLSCPCLCPVVEIGSAQKVDFEMDCSRRNYRLIGAAFASIEAYQP